MLNIVGDSFCDIIASNLSRLPSWGEDSAGNINSFPGGSALNIAAHSSRYSKYALSKKSIDESVWIRIFSALGNGYQAKVCIDLIDSVKQEGFLQDEIVRRQNLQTGTCIVMSGTKDRCFITDRGCMRTMSLSWFDHSKLLSASHIHFGGFYTCDQLQIEIPELFRLAIARGVTTSMNPQFDATGVWGGVADLLPHLTIFFGNELEAKKVTNTTSTEAAAAFMLSKGCQLVVVTKGSQGAEAYRISQQSIVLSFGSSVPSSAIDVIRVPIPCPVDVVDPTGAGDAFVGAFLVEYISSHDILRAMNAGSFSGTAAVTQLGGSSSSAEAYRDLEIRMSSYSSVSA